VDDLQKTEKHYTQTTVAGKINLALVYPNLYALGMSNLGFLTVHRQACQVPGIGVERFFPALKAGVPLPPPYYSFESRRPLGDFDILAFSISFEGDFDKLPGIFGALGIPIFSDQRNQHHPLMIAGGAAVASNSHALSRIFDVLVPGESETCFSQMLERFIDSGIDLSTIYDLPGVWVPSKSSEVTPIADCHQVNVSPAYSHIVTPYNTFGGAHLIEVMRGCPRICAFCLAREIYAPARPVDFEIIKQKVLEFDQCKDIGLVAPSLFDHPQIEEIFEFMHSEGIRVRNSSVKWEKLPDRILELLRLSDIKGVTLAPETGSERLRKAMGKPLSEARFMDTVKRIFQHGFEHLKLYFVACLPDENDEDRDQTIRFIEDIVELAKPFSASVSATFSAFVPKKRTTWQNEIPCNAGEIKRNFRYIKNGLKKIAGRIKVNFESPGEVERQIFLSHIGPELADLYAQEAIEWRENREFSRKDFPEPDF
jgi:radical SAM superfamily enzyme YgiQ (UPF0313 family)